MENKIYKVIIKSINQLFPEDTIICQVYWNFKDLKAHIATLKSDNTFTENRLIHSQRLIRDDELLKKVFSQYTESNPPVLYVAPPPPPPTITPGPSLRKRNNNQPSPTTNLQYSSQMSTNSSIPLHSNPFPTFPTNSQLSTVSFSFTPPQFHQQHFSFPNIPENSVQGSYPQPSMMMGDGGMGSGEMGVGGMVGYSMEQMAWMQHMYQQYMQQYMQFYQQPGDQTTHFMNPAFTPIQPPSSSAPHPHQPPQQPQANDGGGVVDAAVGGGVVGAAGGGGGAFMMEEEDDGRRRDWLDWSYACIRFVMLLCILYFYSTPVKFLTFIALSVAFIIFQTGWIHRLFIQRFFGLRQQQPPPQQPQQQPPQQQPPQQQPPPSQQQPPSPQQQSSVERPDNLQEEAAEQQDPTQQQDTTQQQEQQHHSPFSIIFSFVVGFFTSLAPQIPPPINNNN